MIHYQRLGIAPLVDYRGPRPGRVVVPWSMHPKAALRGTQSTLQPSDLTPFMPAVGNQSRIGACNSYGTKDAIYTSLQKRTGVFLAYRAALPLYRATRCMERAAGGDTSAPLTDSGAWPDDVLTVTHMWGMQTSQQECGEAGPSDALSQYENDHVNDEPTLREFELDSSFCDVGGFDITSAGKQRLLDVSDALASGFAVGVAVYAADDRFQQYTGGIMPDPPAGAGCDHWVYIVGMYLDAAGSPVFVVVNSWTAQWGTSWSKAPGGVFLAGPGIIQAADCLIAYSVQEVTS